MCHGGLKEGRGMGCKKGVKAMAIIQALFYKASEAFNSPCLHFLRKKGVERSGRGAQTKQMREAR